jgi:3-oxoacyl-[acyl-carrier protein] reductase
MTRPGGRCAGGRLATLVTGGARMRARLGDNYQRLIERRARMTPLHRCVTAKDVAATIVSLVVSNPFVTGEVGVVDGGYSALT